MPHEPKKRHSRARQGKRRASIKLTPVSINTCSNCKNLIRPHTICKKCGYYAGKEAIKIKGTEKTA